MKRKTVLAVLVSFWMPAAMAQLSVSSGLDYSEGKYGTSVKSKQWTVPLIARYEADRFSAKLFVPFVHIDNVNPNIRGEALPCAASASAPRNVSGIGDVVATGLYTVYQGGGVQLDAGGKIKFPTGDEDKCLSTGKTDYSLQTDLAKQYGSLTAFGSLGWTKKGDPEFNGVRTDYRNPFYAALGGSYKLSDTTSAGASYDFRQKLTGSGDQISELTLFVTHRLTPGLKLQGYVVHGFSDASPDFGLGAVVTAGF